MHLRGLRKRLAAFVLTAAMGVTAAASTAQAANLSFPTQLQNNMEYSGLHYGWNTIGNSACGPAALCNSLDAGNIARIDLTYMCEKSVGWGARESEGTNIYTLMKRASKAYDFTYSTTSSTQTLKEHLEKGGVAILYSHGSIFSRGGHFVAAIGITKDDRVVVSDSYWSASKYSSYRVVNTGTITATLGECGNCSPFFLIKSKRNITKPVNHSHSYSKKSTVKASVNSTGRVKYKCTRCSKEKYKFTYQLARVELSATSYSYNGKSKKPKVRAYDALGNRISKKNFKVSYPNGTKSVGVHTVRIKFCKKYSGSKDINYRISRR